MWKPKYSIEPKLLRIIREIGESLGTIKAQRVDAPKLAKLALEARALSTFASTSIEGNPLPLTDVKRLLKSTPGQIVDSEREVLNYNRALTWVHETVKAGKFELTTKTFETIQGMVVDGLMENKFEVGRIRQKPVVIRDPLVVDRIVFLPPDHKDVARLLSDLFAFVSANQRDMDPVLLAGLFHKQAVIIHPFMDGNGRSTRLMTSAILGLTGLDLFPIFSFEAYYNRNVTRYFRYVGESGDYYDASNNTSNDSSDEAVEGYDFSAWLTYFAEGILDELKRVEKELPKGKPKLEAHLQVVLDYLEQQGSISQRDYAKLSDRSLAARKKDLAKLLSLGLIEPQGQGRARVYVLA